MEVAEINNEISYREPGQGAIDFGANFTSGLEMESARPIIKQLMKGELHDSGDKRVKRCDYCGYFYRDATRPNNSKTCSKECKIDRDTLKRKMEQADKQLLKRKHTKREQYYAHWLEYPFWSNEYEMLKQSWKNEASYSPEKVERIWAARNRTERMGGKRKPKRHVPYDGRSDEPSGKVKVKFTGTKKENEQKRKPSAVKTWRMDPSEMEEYFASRYSEYHLWMERRRASKFSRSKKV